MFLTLRPMEIRIAELIGNVRHEMNRMNGVQNRQRGPQSPLFIDINGVAGELAAGRHLNVYPDFTVTCRSGGYDLHWAGLRVDVKTTHHQNGVLIVHKADYRPENNEIDAYLLVRGDYTAMVPKFEVVGWEFAESVRQDRYWNTMGFGECWNVPAEDLRLFTERGVR